MKIIKINPFKNGGHDNQIINNPREDFAIPDGWAVIPDDMETPNFPYGEITVDKINDITTVTKWVAIDIPEPEPEEPTPSVIEQIRADVDYIAIMTGVTL